MLSILWGKEQEERIILHLILSLCTLWFIFRKNHEKNIEIWVDSFPERYFYEIAKARWKCVKIWSEACKFESLGHKEFRNKSGCFKNKKRAIRARTLKILVTM